MRIRVSGSALFLVGAIVLVAASSGLLAGAVTPSGAAATSTSTTTTTQPSDSPLDANVVRYLRTRTDTVSIGIFDVTTNQTWSLNSDLVFHAASVAKVNLMAAFLYQTQRHHQAMSSDDAGKLQTMIVYSDNVNADYFYNKVGSCKGLAAFNALIPMPSTTPGCPFNHIYGWGTTSTNVLDQLSLFNLFVAHNSILSDASRAYGLNLLTHISAANTWGVTTGPPPGTTIAFKNGWSPLDSLTNWEINSVGWLRGSRRNYEIAILSRHNPSYAYGVSTVNYVAQLLWNTMGATRYGTPTTTTTMPPAPRADRG